MSGAASMSDSNSQTVDNDPEDKADTTYYTWAFILGGVVVIVLWLAVTWIAVQFAVPKLDIQLIGDGSKLGDAFGIVNALFSALAFVGVIVAILMQRRELQLQRRDLALTQKELKRSADAQTKSEEALSKQANSLLLAAYLNALNSLQQFQLDDMDIQGRRAMRQHFANVVEQLRPIAAFITDELASGDAQEFDTIYSAMHRGDVIFESLVSQPLGDEVSPGKINRVLHELNDLQECLDGLLALEDRYWELYQKCNIEMLNILVDSVNELHDKIDAIKAKSSRADTTMGDIMGNELIAFASRWQQWTSHCRSVLL